MADLFQVEEALVTAVAETIYNGSYTPYSVVSSNILSGSPQFRLMRGFPVDNQLITDLAGGITNVTVFSQPATMNMTRMLRQNAIATTVMPTATMTASVSNNVLTFSGTASTNETIGVSVGNNYGHAYRLLANDTPTSVASVFAGALPFATANGASITFATSEPIGCAVGADVTTAMEIHRQSQIWRVSVWAPTTDLRDQFCSIIDPGLQVNDRLLFSDNSVSEPVVSAGTFVDDIVEKESMWRRDLLYRICYPTVYVQTVPVMVQGVVSDNALSTWFQSNYVTASSTTFS